MGYWYYLTMTLPPIAEGIPDIICQRVLAEGYTLVQVDPGKHIYRTHYDLSSRVKFRVAGGRWAEAPVTLTVSFFPTPKKIEVKFHFELDHELGEEKHRLGFQSHCESQFETFRAHINEWIT